MTKPFFEKDLQAKILDCLRIWALSKKQRHEEAVALVLGKVI
jgi:hypothetical protein